MDLIGQKFGRLTVIGYDNERSHTKNYKKGVYKVHYWECLCDCGNSKSVEQGKLTSGNTKSCGCFQKEARYTNHKKYNKYELSEDGEYYLIEIDDNNIAFIDKDDYEKASKYFWSLNDSGYAVHIFADGSMLRMHRYILNLNENHTKDNLVTDHINRNKLDNRKSNLRITTQHNNSFNSNVGKNNQSGYIGVSYSKRNKSKPWKSSVTYNRKTIYLGNFSTKEEAIKIRLLAEIKYFGKDFAPQRHLFSLFLAKEEYL